MVKIDPLLTTNLADVLPARFPLPCSFDMTMRRIESRVRKMLRLLSVGDRLMDDLSQFLHLGNSFLLLFDERLTSFLILSFPRGEDDGGSGGGGRGAGTGFDDYLI